VGGNDHRKKKERPQKSGGYGEKYREKKTPEAGLGKSRRGEIRGGKGGRGSRVVWVWARNSRATPYMRLSMLCLTDSYLGEGRQVKDRP